MKPVYGVVAPEPSHLALGIMARVLLNELDVAAAVERNAVETGQFHGLGYHGALATDRFG